MVGGYVERILGGVHSALPKQFGMCPGAGLSAAMHIPLAFRLITPTFLRPRGSCPEFQQTQHFNMSIEENTGAVAGIEYLLSSEVVNERVISIAKGCLAQGKQGQKMARRGVEGHKPRYPGGFRNQLF